MISRTIKKFLFILTVFSTLIGCSSDSDEPGLPAFSTIETLDPINTDASGTTFRGSIVQEGENSIVSFGFIFENLETEFEQEIIANELSENEFQTRVDFCFLPGFAYNIRAFVNYSDTTVFGHWVSFISRACNESIWAQERSFVTLDESFGPHAWSDDEYGYVIFQNGKTFKFDPSIQQFSQLSDLPPSDDDDPGRFTAISLNEKQYLLNDASKNLYVLNDDNWLVQSDTPFDYDFFGGYYHGFEASGQIYILSSTFSYRYTPESDVWEEITDVPATNYSLTGTDLNGIAYVMDNGEKAIHRYNPQEDTWEFVTVFPGLDEYRFYSGKIMGFAHQDKLYFGFEQRGNGHDIDERIWSYDLVTNQWDEIQMFPVDLGYGDYFYFKLKGKLYIGHRDMYYPEDFVLYSLDFSLI